MDIVNPDEIAYIGSSHVADVAIKLQEDQGFVVDKFDNNKSFKKFISTCSILDSPGIILIEEEENVQELQQTIKELRTDPLTSGAIIILLVSKMSNKKYYQSLGVNDIYSAPYNAEMIAERINFLIKFKIVKSYTNDIEKKAHPEYKMDMGKRLVDILVSSTLILLLSPILLIIALLIKATSKGPVVYKSKRAGTGYKIFDFYKFRSMSADADKNLKNLSASHNQYDTADGKTSQAFVKILNDPRITKLGAFLRKTSLDELPQLFNVLKGDISLVGNRPLPLYEAEMLTSDEFAMRFLGPAGITGLWQISKRGKAEMSSEERIALDNHYAKYASFWMDVKIVLKTIPAMLQKEKV